MKHLILFSGLIIIIITLLILVLIPSPFGTPSTQLKGPYDLSSKHTLFTNKKFIENTSVTFQGFLYLEKVQKTSTLASCSSTDPSMPSCDSGRYSLCPCAGGDCTNCYHQGYIPIINFNNICTLEVLGAPDSSRQGMAAVQFTMKTQSSTGLIYSSNKNKNSNTKKSKEEAQDEQKNDQAKKDEEQQQSDEQEAQQQSDEQEAQQQRDKEENVETEEPEIEEGFEDSSTTTNIYFETFVLPPIPFQKWIMLTITREGRRFDFYYNNKLILSKQSSTVLYNSLCGNISIGNGNLNGSSAYFSLYPTMQSISDITNQYKSLSDTRGMPLLDESPLSLGLTNIINPGVCTGDSMNPSTPPAQPFYEWSSSYA